KASETGDIFELSSTDIDVLALALDEKATLLTNDLAVQNVCRSIGINYDSFKGKNITTGIEWGYRCVGCDRKFTTKLEQCPHCGSELKKYPVRRRKLPNP
ncbi:MAG: ribonuclease VapC, partial [Thermoplasmatales archaeon]